MKDFTFYEEFKHKRKNQSAGNVCAVIRANRCFLDGKIQFEGLAGVFEASNSPVMSTGVSAEFLSKKCKRISEQKARKIHPALFERLDKTDK